MTCFGWSEHRERELLFWRREGLVQLLEIPLGQHDVERLGVVAHVSERRGLGDRAHTRLPQHPRQRDLTRARAVARRDLQQMCADSWRWQSTYPEGFGASG